MRAMRRNYMIENYDDDFGYVYVPTDSKALETIKTIIRNYMGRYRVYWK